MNQIICTIRKSDKGISFESTIQEYPLKWTKPVVTYCLLQGTTDIPDQHEIVEAIGLMFTTWGAEIPLKFKRVKSTESPDLTYKWMNAQDDPILKTDPTAIMGYSGFPDASQTAIHVILNDSLNWNFTGTNFGWNPGNTLLHETGHCLGLVHSPDDPNSIMYPSYNGKLMLDDLDKSRIQAKYGKRGWLGSGYQRLITFLTYKKTHMQ